MKLWIKLDVVHKWMQQVCIGGAWKEVVVDVKAPIGLVFLICVQKSKVKNPLQAWRKGMVISSTNESHQKFQRYCVLAM